MIQYLTLSRRRPLSYRNQSIGLLCKLMDWFLYANGLRHERVNIPMCLVYINDNLRNNSNITISQRLKHDLFEKFSPFILFF